MKYTLSITYKPTQIDFKTGLTIDEALRAAKKSLLQGHVIRIEPYDYPRLESIKR